MFLALQEWRHWLVGSAEPVVWTDHENLLYLRNTDKLNSRQAQLVLFLGCLKFSLNYRPCYHPVFLKSPQFGDRSHPASLLYCWRCFLASRGEDPRGTAIIFGSAGCPTNQLFIPDSVHLDVIQWGPCFKNYLPSSSHMDSALLRQHFWWLSMNWDVQDVTVEGASFNLLLAFSIQLLPLVAHRSGLCHWVSPVGWEYCHPHRC